MCGVLCMWSKKEHAYGPWQALQGVESSGDKASEFGGSADNRSANPMIFHVVPDLLVGVEFRRIRWQEEQAESAFHAGDEVPYRPAAVNRVAVEDQENRTLGVVHETLQEFGEDHPVYPSAEEHEAHFAAGAHRRKHIHRVSSPRAGHNRCLPSGTPGGACVIVASHTRLIAKQDRSSGLRRRPADRRKLLFAPASDPLRVLFGGTEQRTLAAQTQLPQQPTHAAHAQLHRALLPQQRLDHIARSTRPNRPPCTSPAMCKCNSG